MSEKSLRLASKFAATLALVALPAFGVAALTTHQSAPTASVAGTVTNGEADTTVVEPTPTPSTSKDTTGWD
ncbi:hypothetical protein ABZV60_12640 [Streptomyces sp. NPDC004787]|uniref:hypothetical protein n=1 Tax=Streptomyces sp. NPDC004787 TaxID=3154291 RepID=UPI0033AA27E3